jgi:hypothetical protein
MNTDLSVLASIRADCVKDASNLDGLPLTGKTVGECFGNVLAMIDTLAAVMERQVRKQNFLHEGD